MLPYFIQRKEMVMVTKYNIGDRIITDYFNGIVSMITITKKGVRYRAYGEYIYETGMIIPKSQHDIWEDEIKN